MLIIKETTQTELQELQKRGLKTSGRVLNGVPVVIVRHPKGELFGLSKEIIPLSKRVDLKNIDTTKKIRREFYLLREDNKKGKVSDYAINQAEINIIHLFKEQIHQLLTEQNECL